MASRTASIRAPFSGRKNRGASQKVSVTYPGRPGHGVEPVDGPGRLPDQLGVGVGVGGHVAAGQHVGAAGAVHRRDVEPSALKAWATRVVPQNRSRPVRAPEASARAARAGTRRRFDPRYLIIRAGQGLTAGRTAANHHCGSRAWAWKWSGIWRITRS